jgi:hypothetical protein
MMDGNIVVNGRRIYKMDKEPKSYQINLVLKVNFFEVKSMEKESLYGQMEVIMKVNGKMEKSLAE